MTSLGNKSSSEAHKKLSYKISIVGVGNLSVLHPKRAGKKDIPIAYRQRCMQR